MVVVKSHISPIQTSVFAQDALRFRDPGGALASRTISQDRHLRLKSTQERKRSELMPWMGDNKDA